MRKSFKGLGQFKSFLDRYRALTTATALILFSLCAHAQYDSTKFLQPVSIYGNDNKNGRFHSSLIIANDTPRMALKDSGAIAYKGRNLWAYNGVYWEQKSSITVIGGGAGIDSIIITNVGDVNIWKDGTVKTFQLNKFLVEIVNNWDSTGLNYTNYLGDSLGTVDLNYKLLRVSGTGIRDSTHNVIYHGKTRQERVIYLDLDSIGGNTTLQKAFDADPFAEPHIDATGHELIFGGATDYIFYTNPTDPLGYSTFTLANNYSYFGNQSSTDVATVRTTLSDIDNTSTTLVAQHSVGGVDYSQTVDARPKYVLIHPGGEQHGTLVIQDAPNLATIPEYSLVSDADTVKKYPYTAPTVVSNFSQTGSATSTFTVTLPSTQTGTAYKINLTPTSSTAASLFYVTNKTTTTFDVTYLSARTGSVTFDYILTQ